MKFVIFGRIIHTNFFINELNKRGYEKPVVIVSPDNEYLRDKILLERYGLWSDLEFLEEQGLCKLYKLQNVNSQETKNILDKEKCEKAISINCRNIFKKEIINYFDNEIFNLHDSYLPNERGGALNSWRILNGVNSVGNTIHLIDEGIDTGPIINQIETEINMINLNQLIIYLLRN